MQSYSSSDRNLNVLLHVVVITRDVVKFLLPNSSQKMVPSQLSVNIGFMK